MKDWTGNSNSIYTTLGASNHTDKEREQHDYYATEPKALELLLEKEQFCPYVWECACGEGHLSEVLKSNGYKVKSSDLIDRGYDGTEVIDFLKVSKEDIKNDYSRDIITNPPYKYAKEFVEQALNISMDGTKIAMFLKIQFLEGKARRELFDKAPPKIIYVASKRLLCAKNGEFEKMRQGRKKMKALKFIHNIITKIMFVLFFVSIGAMDSEALWIPITTFLVSGTWLCVFSYKKGWMFNSVEDGDDDVQNG